MLKIKYLLLPAVVFALIFIGACNEFQITGLETSKVTLNTGINPAASRAVQDDVVSFILTVTAEGMTEVEQSFTGGTVSLEIEAGSARTFTLQALDADDNVLFSGSKTLDLTAGEDADLVIELGYAGFYVTFDTDGGSTLPRQYVEKDGLVTITAAPTKDGSSLVGWYTDEGLTQVWTIADSPVTADMTLYAKWSATYTISYNANGADSGTAPEDQTKIQGTDIMLSANSGNLALTDYPFIGWNTAEDGSGTDYAVGEIYTDDADLTLYAKWSELPAYTISYNANGADSGTAPEDQTKIQGTDIALSANTGNLVLSGYTFMGWNTTSEGTGTDYEVGAVYTSDTNLTLYAKWVYVPVSGVNLNSNITAAIGSTRALSETILPFNASNRSVTWSSSNESIATVDSSGVVTAVAGGSATITVTTVEGSYTASCGVTTIDGAGFDSTGAAQTWTVPGGVSVITLYVWGAEGGGSRLSGNTASGLGGLGGYSTGTLTVTPGEIINIFVGSQGSSSTYGTAAGGWNGGGSGYASSSGEPGNGGGGASDIRIGGSALTDRVIVAGGGGGGGEDSGDPVGQGGGLEGTGYPGYDATQTAAGSGGSLGVGGSTNIGDGGGGGGGYYGGGTTSTSISGGDTQGGGGGSGYIGGVTSGTTTAGVNEGNGYVIISY